MLNVKNNLLYISAETLTEENQLYELRKKLIKNKSEFIDWIYGSSDMKSVSCIMIPLIKCGNVRFVDFGIKFKIK